MPIIKGQCHCGNLTSSLVLPENVASLTLYGCTCSFCRLHACTWLGEPAQSLTLSAEEPAQASWYCTGPLVPNYLLCRHCGVVIATVSYFDDGWYGITNAQTALLPALPQDFMPFRPLPLTDQQRLTLRRERWVRGVRFVGGLSAPTVGLERPPLQGIAS